MAQEPRWRRYARFWRTNVAADVDDELRFHLESRVRELTGQGLTAVAAHQQAADEFGDVERTRTGLREIGERRERRRDRWMRRYGVGQDARYLLRGLRSSPGFTFSVVLTLAVGIGAVTSMYGVTSRLILQPPPHVAAPDRVAKLYFSYERPGESGGIMDASSYPLYELLRDEVRSLAAVAAYAPATELPVGSGADAELVRATLVSAGFGAVTGVRPALGRWIADAEAHPESGARVVVLGDGLWRRRFGADPGVIGTTVLVKGLPYQLIGVAPRGFRGVELADVDLWLPLFARADGGKATWHTFASSSNLRFAVRLRPGVRASQAAAELTPLHHTFVMDLERERSGARERPPVTTRVLAGGVTGALDDHMTRRPEATVALWLTGVSVILLVIACANVASLLLLRAMRRRREIAVRLALGLGRRRLVAQLLAESGALALLGGMAAVAMVVGGGGWVNRVLLPDLVWEPAARDWPLFALAAGCTVVVALLAGLAPALQLRRDPVAALKDGTQHGSARRSSLHRGLLVSQAALSVVLLVGAGLFLRSLQQLRAHDYGLNPDGVLVAQVAFDGAGWKPADRAAFHREALERVSALPGVQDAALATNVPLRSLSGGQLLLPDGTQIATPTGEVTYGSQVTTDYVATTGMRLLAGRGFVGSDASERAVVVNETLARSVWPGRPAVGECVLREKDAPCSTIVGVVADPSAFGLMPDHPRMLFWSVMGPGEATDGALLVRVATGSNVSATTIRSALLELRPGLPYLDVKPLGAVLEPQLRPWRLGATVFTAFGVLAMLLAGLGLYSAVAYAVTQRTREIGVRMAIGAGRGSVVALVASDATRTAVAGVVLGTALALAGSRWIAGLLFEVSPRDPIVYAAVGGAIILVALLASVAPARRATRVNPVTALRAE